MNAKTQNFMQTLGQFKKYNYLCAVVRFLYHIALALTMIVFGTIIYLQLMQVQLLKAIVEKPEIANVVSDDGVIAHGEQRSDNNITIMFNYE